MQEINKTLPSAIETEQTLLGCLINDTNKFIEVDECLNELDFYVDKHKKIYKTIKTLVNKGVTVDLITLTEELRAKDLLLNCGGASYISELYTAALNYSYVMNYAEIIKEKSNRRKLIKTGQLLMSKSFDEDINSVVEETENKLFDVITNKTEDVISIQDAIEESFIAIEERYKSKGKLRGISTGFTEIDKLSSGLRRTDLIILAARPSMGKTAFALNIGQAASQYGNVAVFSIEMSREQLMDRMLSARCLIDFDKIKFGNLNDEQFSIF